MIGGCRLWWVVGGGGDCWPWFDGEREVNCCLYYIFI